MCISPIDVWEREGEERGTGRERERGEERKKCVYAESGCMRREERDRRGEREVCVCVRER